MPASLSTRLPLLLVHLRTQNPHLAESSVLPVSLLLCSPSTAMDICATVLAGSRCRVWACGCSRLRDQLLEGIAGGSTCISLSPSPLSSSGCVDPRAPHPKHPRYPCSSLSPAQAPQLQLSV